MRGIELVVQLDLTNPVWHSEFSCLWSQPFEYGHLDGATLTHQWNIAHKGTAQADFSHAWCTLTRLSQSYIIISDLLDKAYKKVLFPQKYSCNSRGINSCNDLLFSLKVPYKWYDSEIIVQFNHLRNIPTRFCFVVLDLVKIPG